MLRSESEDGRIDAKESIHVSVVLLLVLLRFFAFSYFTNGLSAELFRTEEGLESLCLVIS